MIYPYIPGGFNYSDQVWYITGQKVGITLSASCAEVIIIQTCSTLSMPECDRSRQFVCGINRLKYYHQILYIIILSIPYTIQVENIISGNILSSGERVVNATYPTKMIHGSKWCTNTDYIEFSIPLCIIVNPKLKVFY